MLDGRRHGHASVVVDHDEDQQTIVVTGEYLVEAYRHTNSVLLLTMGSGEKKWKEGPSLNFSRSNHAAAVCNGSVYIIGGETDGKPQSVIEKIDIIDLTRDSSTQWTKEKYTLSISQRNRCAAAVVNNRYIVVAGGTKNLSNPALSTVEIVDTTVESPYAVTSGPSMNVARQSFEMTVIGRRIYAIGGNDGSKTLASVEYLELNDGHQKVHGNTRSVFRLSLTWRQNEDLALSVPKSNHRVVTVGHCLIVGDFQCAEVLDTSGNSSWNLPTLLTHRNGFSMVATRDGVVVIGGSYANSCVSLPLVTIERYIKVRLVLL